MRRLTLLLVLAVAGVNVGAFIASTTPRQVGIPDTADAAVFSTWRSCNEHQRRPRRQSAMSRVRSRSGQQEKEERMERHSDDQQIFWDTVVEVLKSELDDQGEDLSRVWDFVAHNRDGKAQPTSPNLYKATGLYFPGLAATPWWDRSEFPWLQVLEDAAADITREMESLARAGGARSYRGGTGEMSTVYDATQGWGTMRIRYMGRYGQPGVKYALLPRTLSALRRLPLAPETAAFQRQLSGTGLPLHVDPSNFVLGCHMGMVVPEPAVVASSSPRQHAAGNGRRDEKGNGNRNSNSGAGFGGGASRHAAGDDKMRGGKATVLQAAGNRRKRGGSSRKGFAPERPPQAADRSDGSAGRSELIAGGAKTEQEGKTSEHHADGNVRDATGTTVGRGDGGGGERAWMEVAGEKRCWEMGRAFVFDPSFLHRTHNPTSGERVILNVDVWHPGLKKVERAAIRRVCELIEQWNARSGLFEN